METKDHLLLAKALAAALQLHYGRKLAFIFGNLAPDLNPLSYLSPFRARKLNGHSYEHRSHAIEAFLSKKGCRSCYDWYRVGKTAHYLADSFTRPHNEVFAYGYLQHVVYERRLHQVFNGQIGKGITQVPQQLPAWQADDVDAQWYQRCHARYIKESKDCLDDCAYILGAVWAFCTKCKRGK